MAIPGAAPFVGVGNGIYAGVKSWMSGASVGEAFLVAGTAGLCAASSFSYKTNLPKSLSAIVTSASIDFVSSTGFNSTSAAVYRGFTPQNRGYYVNGKYHEWVPFWLRS